MEKVNNIKNIIYIDCFAGCAGDMLLGAFFDMGLPLDDWKDEISKLNIKGIDLSIKDKTESSIKGTKIDIIINNKPQENRKFIDIKNLISNSSLKETVKNESISIFKTIAEAEAKIHSTTIDKVHFHEVGAIDSIVDIVGFCIAKDLMKVDEIYTSEFRLGTGTIHTAHGLMPVPAPATLEIIRGKPAISLGIEGELTTPTGAGILTSLSSGFGKMCDMVIQAVGYGYGTNKLSVPNFLRIIYGNRRGL
jgi:pyridinium-3,5-bisthiocarboxylic acid mononucleotide nickel chelatase